MAFAIAVPAGTIAQQLKFEQCIRKHTLESRILLFQLTQSAAVGRVVLPYLAAILGPPTVERGIAEAITRAELRTGTPLAASSRYMRICSSE
jgi:hypothetical protein